MSTEAGGSVLGRREQGPTKAGVVFRGGGKRSFHLWLLLAITLLTFAVRLVLDGHYTRERGEIEARARAARTHELLSAWSNLRFSQGEQLATLFAARVDWPSLRLSPMQRAKAQQRLRDVLTYLSAPTFDTYYRLKTEDLHFRFSLDPRAAALFRGTNAALRTLPARDAAKVVWDTMFAANEAVSAPRLTGVCLDSIRAVTTTTNSVPALLGGKLFKWITIAYAALDPGFHYGAAQIETHRTNQLFLNLSFYARSSTSTNPGPVHVSLYWSASDSNWALVRMLTDVHLQMDTLF